MERDRYLLTLIDMNAAWLKYYVPKISDLVDELKDAPAFLTEGEDVLDKSIIKLEKITEKLRQIKSTYKAKQPT